MKIAPPGIQELVAPLSLAIIILIYLNWLQASEESLIFI